MPSLVIDGVTMPEPKQGGLSISKEKIWSKNTGRGADGTMNGDVVARKFTLKIEWPILSDAQAAIVDKAIDPAFVKVKFRNPGTGKTVEKTMYAGTPTYPVYSYANGLPRYVGTGVTLIEK